MSWCAGCLRVRADRVRHGGAELQLAGRPRRVRRRVGRAPGPVRDCGQAVGEGADDLPHRADAPPHELPPAVLEVERVQLALVGDVRVRPARPCGCRGYQTSYAVAPSTGAQRTSPGFVAAGRGSLSQRTLKPNGLLHAGGAARRHRADAGLQRVRLTREPREHEVHGRRRDPDRARSASLLRLAPVPRRRQLLVRRGRRDGHCSCTPCRSPCPSRRSTRRPSCRRTSGSSRARTRSRLRRGRGSRRRPACVRTCASSPRSGEARSRAAPWARPEAPPTRRWRGARRESAMAREAEAGRTHRHSCRHHYAVLRASSGGDSAVSYDSRLARPEAASRFRSCARQSSCR